MIYFLPLLSSVSFFISSCTLTFNTNSNNTNNNNSYYHIIIVIIITTTTVIIAIVKLNVTNPLPL